jgi:hypothetical protein
MFILQFFHDILLILRKYAYRASEFIIISYFIHTIAQFHYAVFDNQCSTYAWYWTPFRLKKTYYVISTVSVYYHPY